MTITKSTIQEAKSGQDSLGRTQRKKQEEVLAAYARSGQTRREFAASVGMKHATLARWAGKARRREKAVGAAAIQGPRVNWVEAVAESGAEGGTLIVEMAGGVRLQVTTTRQAELAGAVIRAMGEGRPC